MKKIVIIDHRDAGRHKQMATCLRQPNIDISWFPQVYGAPSLDDGEVAEFTEDLRARSATNLQASDVILLHAGEQQHFVPAILWKDIISSIPCLLFTALPAQRSTVQEYLDDNSKSPLHVALPGRFYPEPDTGWAQSRQGLALKQCVEAILCGIRPNSAVRSAFGDPDLDRILDEMYEKLKPGPPRADLKGIRIERDARLEAHYEKTRGWRNRAIGEGE